jgi:aspartyl-tRNA(Asn)/glutamyl-tRNA(Gln) amidotransferase subunit C
MVSAGKSEKIDVAYVAHLARMQLTQEEIDKFQSQLEDVLGYVNQIKEVDVSSVPDTPIDPTLPTNALREDIVYESLPREAALSNAPAKANDLISVPKIVE